MAYGGNNTAGAIEVATACRAKGGSGHGDFESETFIAHTLRGDGFDASEDGTGRGTPLVPVPFRVHGENSHAAIAFPERMSGTQFASTEELAPSMGALNPTAVQRGAAVRRLTPLECERLQGMQDGQTAITHRGKPAADGPRYKAIGNSWAVNCARWIGERIAMVDAIGRE